MSLQDILARCTNGGCGWEATEIGHIEFDENENLFCPCCHKPMEDMLRGKQ